MLVVADMIPPTSDVIPLVGIFFNAAVVEMVSMIISLCVVLRFYHKQATDPPMPNWMRKYVLDYLSYKLKVRCKVTSHGRRQSNQSNIELTYISKRNGDQRLEISQGSKTYPRTQRIVPNNTARRAERGYTSDQRSVTGSESSERHFEMGIIARKIDVIIDKLSQKDKDEMYRQEWRIVAMTFDKCLFITFCTITILTITFVFLNSPGYVK